jgi:hypothetical protein
MIPKIAQLSTGFRILLISKIILSKQESTKNNREKPEKQKKTAFFQIALSATGCPV